MDPRNAPRVATYECQCPRDVPHVETTHTESTQLQTVQTCISHCRWICVMLCDWPRQSVNARCRSSLNSISCTNMATVDTLNTHNRLMAFLSGTTRVGRYEKKHSPTHTHPDHQTSFISFLHLLWSTASSLFNLRAWQSFSTTSLKVVFGLGPSTSYSMHFRSHQICATPWRVTPRRRSAWNNSRKLTKRHMVRIHRPLQDGTKSGTYMLW